jgi:hypothetical protein
MKCSVAQLVDLHGGSALPNRGIDHMDFAVYGTSGHDLVVEIR